MKRRRADLAHLDSYSQEYKTTWQRIKRGGVSWDEYVAKVRKRAANRIRPLCSVKECGSPVSAKGFCCAHYNRLMRNGDPLKVRQPVRIWWA